MPDHITIISNYESALEIIAVSVRHAARGSSTVFNKVCRIREYINAEIQSALTAIEQE